MATFQPFSAIRPRKGLEDRIAALPYDVYNRQEAKAEVAREPMSFLKIDRAESQFPDDVDTYAPCVYEKARDTLMDMVEEGAFVKERTDSYYLYELTMDGRSQTGIAGCAAIDEYLDGTIKKHENTRADKEEDRIRHVDTCSAQTGPIFLAYRFSEAVEAVTASVKSGEPLYDFTSPDGITHRMWAVSDRKQVAALQEAFAAIPCMYIADGHHRAASAVKVGLKRREEHPGYDGTEPFNSFLSVAFPDSQLDIMDYNRVVKDLNGYDLQGLLSEIEKNFDIEKREGAYRPEKKGCFGMYVDGSWYRLTAKEALKSSHPVDGLDVSILQDHLLSPILGIREPKTDQRIDFVGGIRGLAELERRVSADCSIAFSMYPTSIGELFAVADAGLLMPPKSTWFEPKLRSGLLIHQI